MNPYVKEVIPLENFELELTFENGETRIFDLKPYLKRGIFARLADPGTFNSARVLAGSVEWQGGIDLSYDTLYLEGRPVETARTSGRSARDHK